MLLAIDVGNTNTVLGVFKGKQLAAEWRIRTEKDATADEFSVLARQLFAARGISESEVDKVIISCVAPPLKRILDIYVKKYLKQSPVWISADLDIGMPILLDNPAEVGADRIVNAVAAFDKYRSALVVIDFGTATTFDCISKKGEYMGGAISPGIGIAAEALFKHASKLPRVEIFEAPKNAIGKDTITSMQSGIILGYASLVDGLVEKITKEIKGQVTVMATGGLAPLMAGVCKHIRHVEPDLTLEGLRLIHEKLTKGKAP